MTTRSLSAEIIDYIEHFCDVKYLVRVVAQNEDADLTRALLDLLRGDDAAVSAACLFIRDVITLAPEDENLARFRLKFPRSVLMRELEELLLSDRSRARCDAVYTLGKTCSRESLPSLIAALEVWRERDPLILPSLLGEIWWLQEEDDFSLLEPLVSSTRFLTRWAILDVLQRKSGEKIEGQRQKIFHLLNHDSHPLVRDEANYLLHLIDLDKTKPPRAHKLPKSVRNAHNEKLAALRPLSFSDIQLSFRNEMEKHKTVSYTVEQVEEFVAREAEKPR